MSIWHSLAISGLDNVLHMVKSCWSTVLGSVKYVLPYFVSPAFKARSATCVSYVNEKRVTHKIPDKFVYQTVKMICIHYGTPKIRENSAKKHTRFVINITFLMHTQFKLKIP